GCWIAAYDQYFDFDKSVIKDQFKPVIKKAADILRAHPALTVIIAGHTDRIGTEAYNMGLGERRALAVRKLLIEYGVPAERLKYRSYGESQPKADNRTAEGRSKNRRVEIHVYQPGIGRPVK
ncbi:MAG: OmpA family protein, partial [Proteobacteria bacterium]|nr:OmpA family protein [Pseudomonadota bacterium]